MTLSRFTTLSYCSVWEQGEDNSSYGICRRRRDVWLYKQSRSADRERISNIIQTDCVSASSSSWGNYLLHPGSPAAATQYWSYNRTWHSMCWPTKLMTTFEQQYGQWTFNLNLQLACSFALLTCSADKQTLHYYRASAMLHVIMKHEIV